MSLRVAIDVTPLLTPPTGIRRSVEETVAALGQLPDGPELRPFAFARQLPAGLPAGTRRVPLPTRLAVAAWSRGSRPRADRWLPEADVVHATNFVVPPSRRPTVVTVHDCSFLLHPDTVEPLVLRFGPLLRRAFEAGAVAHVTTAEVGRQVDALLAPGLAAAGRVEVVPFGVPALPSSSAGADDRVRALLDLAPSVVAIGRSEPRKNLVRLVQAFAAAAPDTSAQLLLAGPDGADRARLDASVAALPASLSRRVVLLGPVGEPTRRLLLERATLLAYPSLYEGFGFPVLEAMSLGTPVLTSTDPVLAEVAGGAAALAEATDVEALAGALSRLLADGDERRRLAAAGQERAASFSWERTARGLTALYERLAERTAS